MLPRVDGNGGPQIFHLWIMEYPGLLTLSVGVGTVTLSH